MNQMRFVICGPTATGKSELAQRLAIHAGGVVLSADSMQVYRGMDIGTAKVPPEKRLVEHFGLDLTDPDEPYSASLYQSYSRVVMDEAEEARRPVVITGGTGLYIQAALDDLKFPKGEQANNPIRERYSQMAEEKGSSAVWDELNKMDPKSAQHIHPNNLKRVIRALEMAHEGESYSERTHGLKEGSELYPALYIGLSMERSLLYERIGERVDAMREMGLVDEVRKLAEEGFASSLTARQAIGYKEILSAFEGEISLDEAFEDIKQATRRYAKRQGTWFRRDERIHWIDVTKKGEQDVMEEAMHVMDRFCEDEEKR